MTFRAYGPEKRLRADALEMIGQVNQVLAQAKVDGVSMTLRNVHYKFVKNKWYPNTDSSYQKLKRVVGDGRLAGLISWEEIEDQERDLHGFTTYAAPEQILSGMADKYHRDLWAGQVWRPEVWVEKKGMTNVVSGICNQLRVDFFACKGYNSLTEAWKAGQRMADYIQRGQRPIVFHLGDHDPSGLDMTRDNRERLELFAGVPVMVVRLALNMDQVEELNLPPDPAKSTDSRFDAYELEYGTKSSWEIDALEPTYIRDLIASNVRRIRDEGLWDEALAQEVEDKRYLKELAGEL
jgi:hypothetical protein